MKRDMSMIVSVNNFEVGKYFEGYQRIKDILN